MKENEPIKPAQEAMRRHMEAAGGVAPPPTLTQPLPTSRLPIEERAEAALARTSTITQSLADAHYVTSQLEERLFGGGGASPTNGASVQDSLRAHVERLTGLLARL